MLRKTLLLRLIKLQPMHLCFALNYNHCTPNAHRSRRKKTIGQSPKFRYCIKLVYKFHKTTLLSLLIFFIFFFHHSTRRAREIFHYKKKPRAGENSSPRQEKSRETRTVKKKNKKTSSDVVQFLSINKCPALNKKINDFFIAR